LRLGSGAPTREHCDRLVRNLLDGAVASLDVFVAAGIRPVATRRARAPR
jgi:tRNA G18 (ribose-2'-O)-methylase SpoU